MFRFRVRREFHPRSNKGAPPHRTTGAASASCSHPKAVVMPNSCSPPEVSMPPMLIARRGTVSASPIQNRRRMLRNSVSFSSPAFTALRRGSRAMPQIGHDPGVSEMISGCIGQTYSVFAPVTGCCSRAIPHLGQGPGLSEMTSGSIGQKYFDKLCCAGRAWGGRDSA